VVRSLPDFLLLDKNRAEGRSRLVRIRLVGGILTLVCWVSLPSAAGAAEPRATPPVGTDGHLTLECKGTTKANGVESAESRTYTVDTKLCAVAPWPAGQCKCIDTTIACDNRDEGNSDRFIVNRVTTKVVHHRANWEFVGHCKRRSP
jgi:hypothetical protein